MRIDWVFDDADIAAVRSVVREQAHNAFVQMRQRRNVERERPEVGRSQFWHMMVSCLLTSQQRSGPNSPASLLIHQDPFPLSLEICLRHDDLPSYTAAVLRNRRGIRFINKIPQYMLENLEFLNRKYWPTVDQHIRDLRRNDGRNLERNICCEYVNHFRGVGPKQARNLLQGLGLAKYEIPLDSRINRWLNEVGFPVPLSSTVLSDEGYYEIALDGIQELCRRADVLPCIFDASVFSAVDGAAWTAENATY